MPIATPEIYAQMLDRAKRQGFAYPAINVSSSQTIPKARRAPSQLQLSAAPFLQQSLNVSARIRCWSARRLQGVFVAQQLKRCTATSCCD